MIRPDKIAAICLTILLAMNLYGQQGIPAIRFDSVYNRATSFLFTDTAKALKFIRMVESDRESLTDIQRARLEYFWLRYDDLRKNSAAAFAKKTFTSPDSLQLTDSMQYYAHRYLERSMPDLAIPLLMKAMDGLPVNSNDADFVVIELCEAYRQKQEYGKGIRLIYRLLSEPKKLSDKNRAFAYNRLAALYNESGKPAGNYRDSVVKYSRLCLELAGKTGDKPAQATAQNELGFQYIHRKEYEKAIHLFGQSMKNFLSSGMRFQAMNVLINKSIAFKAMGQYRSAQQSLDEATRLASLRDNRNLFMRIYHQYASVYATTGHYKEAYEFLLLCNQLQIEFFKDRMNSQIVEQSARFDLYVKEQQIRDEQKKNEYTHRQILLLIIIIISIVLAFLFSIFYFRLRRKDVMKQKLIEAVVETENNERRRIARDLHDGLGPVLSAINHYFQAYLDAKPDKKEAIQERLQQVITEAIDEVSRISQNISPHVLEKHGLVTALNNLFAPLIVNGNYEVVFDPGNCDRLDPKVELTVYRCITELLNNTLKHARASKVGLALKVSGVHLHIHYTDNGVGYDASTQKKGGMGLHNITNRVESSGGSFTIDSSPNAGISVLITMPL